MLFFDLLFVPILLVLNGFFSLCEKVLKASKKTRLRELYSKDAPEIAPAIYILDLREQILLIIKILITATRMLIGAIVISLLAEKTEYLWRHFAIPERYHFELSVCLIITITTYLCMVVGDILPRQIALSNPEKLLLLLIPTIRIMEYTCKPFVEFLAWSSSLILRILKIPVTKEPSVTEEEIKVLIQQGTEDGTFEETEQAIVERVFRLSDRKINLLMIPRHDVVYLDVEDEVMINQKKLQYGHFSRYPLVRGDLDNTIGVVYIKDLLKTSLDHVLGNLEEKIHPPLFVPESITALNLIDLFKKSHSEVAFVVDEYGGFQGLITLKDILKAMIGNISLGDEEEKLLITKKEDGSWLIDGMLPIDEMKSSLNIDNLPRENENTYHTLGGFIITYLGKIPSVSDHFVTSGCHFEVIDMDGNRVDKVLVTKLPSQL